jgi:AcrR family transcriptional regulator
MAQRARTKNGGRRFPDGYDPEATRKALLDSALGLFEAKGFAATSVQQITEGAGVTKGAFYHHFESKEDLLRLIHDEFVDVQLAALEQVIDEYDDPATQLHELLRMFLISTARYQANVTVFFQERRYLTGEPFHAVKSKRDRFDRMFRSVVERGVQQGTFRSDLDPRIVGLGILGMCAWTYQWYRPRGRFSAEQIADIYAGIIIDGLRAGK